MSDAPTAGRELDAAFDDLLRGTFADEPVGLLVGELRAAGRGPAPAPSAALRQLLAGVAPERVAEASGTRGREQAAAILAALPAEEVARRYRVGRTVAAALVAGATVLGLTGVAAAHDALPEPAQTVMTTVVNRLTPFHIGPPDGDRRPVDPVGAPAPDRGDLAGVALPQARLSLPAATPPARDSGPTSGGGRAPDAATRRSDPDPRGARPGAQAGPRRSASAATHHRASTRQRVRQVHKARHAAHKKPRRAVHHARHRQRPPTGGHGSPVSGTPAAASGARHGARPGPRGGAPVRAGTPGATPAPAPGGAASAPAPDGAAPAPAPGGAAPTPGGAAPAPAPHS